MTNRILSPFRFLARHTFRSRFATSAAAVLLTVGVVWLATCADPPAARAQKQQQGLRDAPELVGGTDWFNTDMPIKLADLRGRIVVLDFWTLC